MNAKIAAIADYFEFEDADIRSNHLTLQKRRMSSEIAAEKRLKMLRICAVDQIVHLDRDLLDAAADLIERRKYDRKLSMERKQRRIQRNREYSADLQLAGLI